jgi:hypothetical protein
MVFSSKEVQTSQPECRYCLETDVLKNLVAPCICKGSFQYVHQDCLMKWYTASPEKGLLCSACNTMLARKYTHTLEINPQKFPFMPSCLQNPMIIVLYVHIVYAVLYLLFSEQVYYINLYTLVQSIFHGIQIGKMVALTLRIENQGRYWRLWVQNRRILLPIVHIFILSRLHYTFIIGGVSADICLCVYFYEHLAIVQTINDHRSFIFTNRLE